ncbi:hypothetical protein HKD37_03G007578 [Glycine soja]
MFNVGERLRQFKSDLTSKWALAADKETIDDTVCGKHDISKEKWAQFCQTRRDPSWEVRCVKEDTGHLETKHCPSHVVSSGKQVNGSERNKKLEEAAQSESIDIVIDPPSPIRRHVKWKMTRTKKTRQMTSKTAKEIDVLTAALGRPEHPGCVRAAGANVTIKQYFGLAPRTSHTSSSMAPEDQEQLTQQIMDQLDELITKKMTRQLMLSFSQMQSQERSRQGDSDKCGLYIEENPLCLVALERLYEGSIIVHNIPLLHDQVKVGVEEVRDVDSPIPVSTEEVKLVGQALNTFLAWPTHLVKHLLEHEAVGLAKPADKPDHDADDPLYLMTLTIPQLFLKLLHMTETSMQAGNADVYGFLEPQFIQRSEQS